MAPFRPCFLPVSPVLPFNSLVSCCGFPIDVIFTCGLVDYLGGSWLVGFFFGGGRLILPLIEICWFRPMFLQKLFVCGPAVLRTYFWFWSLVGLERGHSVWCWGLNPACHVQGKHLTHFTIFPAPDFEICEHIKNPLAIFRKQVPTLQQLKCGSSCLGWGP